MDNEQINQDVRTLPLWKDLFDKMEAAGLVENKTWPISFFVQGIGAAENSAQLSFGLHNIRKALRRLGWTFTSRGHNGQQYWITPRNQNADEMIRMQNLALSSLREGVILGTSTPLDSLSCDERRRHESVLEKMAIRSALMSRKFPSLAAPVDHDESE